MQAATIDQTISIQKCPSCLGSHENLVPTEYKSNRTDGNHGTHWCSCPSTGDPFSLSFYVDDNGQILIIEPDVLDMLRSTFRDEVWMLAFFHKPEGSESIRLERKTFNYPHADFERSVAELRKNLLAEVNPGPGGQMSEGKLAPRLELFGDPSGQ